MPAAVELTDVHKWFPKAGGYREILTFWRRVQIPVLRGISLTVPEGDSFGILGVNGAGKTTLLKVLSGLMLANSGRVEIGGVDVTRGSDLAHTSLMYISSEERTHYMRLSGWQNLDFYADLFEIPIKQKKSQINSLVELVGLSKDIDEKVIRYSSGMKQRLAIARGLLSDPDILLLDEPTRSLDPVGARDLWAFIREELMAVQNKTVILATHDMEEATVLCDTVEIIDGGTIVASESVDELRESYSNRNNYIVTLNANSNSLESELSRVDGLSGLASSASGDGNIQVAFTLDDPARRMPQVLEVLARHGSVVTGMTRHQVGLGDVVAELTTRRT